MFSQWEFRVLMFVAAIVLSYGWMPLSRIDRGLTYRAICLGTLISILLPLSAIDGLGDEAYSTTKMFFVLFWVLPGIALFSSGERTQRG